MAAFPWLGLAALPRAELGESKCLVGRIVVIISCAGASSCDGRDWEIS